MTIKGHLSVLRRVHRSGEIDTADEDAEVRRRLDELLAKGLIEKMLPRRPRGGAEDWFRDVRWGVVFRYVAADFPSKGLWEEVRDPDRERVFFKIFSKNSPTQAEYESILEQVSAGMDTGLIEERPLPAGYLWPKARCFVVPSTGEMQILGPPLEEGETGMWDFWSRGG